MSRLKFAAFAALPTVLFASFFALGYAMASRVSSQDRLVADAEAFVSGQMLLGRVADAARKDQIAAAYLDPAVARAGMDEFAWAGFVAMTPFVGYAPLPGRWGSATINEHQLRSPAPLATPKPEGSCRVFVTGGSTAFGSGAPDDARTIAGYLEGMLRAGGAPARCRRFEVLTGAAVAWSTTHERIFIENRLSELEPDLVISFSGNNDVHFGDRKHDVLWHRSGADGNHWHLIRRIYDGTALGPLREFVKGEPERVPAETVTRRLIKNVRLSAYALRVAGVPYLYALQPNLLVTRKALTPEEQEFAAEPDADRVEHHRRCYAALREALAELSEPNLRFVDVSGVFDGLDANTMVFLDKFHLGDRGNELVARALFPHAVEALATPPGA
jgi:hypothetical protein